MKPINEDQKLVEVLQELKTLVQLTVKEGMLWATKETIIHKMAECPEKWFYRFAIAQPDDVRKFAKAANGTLLFRVKAVLEAIEKGKYLI